MRENNALQKIKKLVVLAVFAAIAYVLHFIHIPVQFLNLDFKDVVMTIAGMYFGPLSGLTLTVLVPLLEFPTSSTGLYGLIMNILSSTAFVVAASSVYRFRRTLSGAIAGLCAAVFSATAVMMLANLFITPYYMGVERSMVAALIPTLLLPFNFIKALLNAALTLCLYKPITRVLKSVGIRRGSPSAVTASASEGFHGRTALVWLIGGGIAVISLIIIFTVLGGTVAIA